MSNTTFKTKIKHKIDTTANWTTNSSVVLENGEIGFERTSSGSIKFKIGDGQKTWTELPYVNTNNGSGGGTTYTAGNGIKIENDIISTTYGTSVLQNYVLNSSTNFGLDVEIEEIKLNSFFYLIPNNQIEFIQHPFTIIFKENNSQISSLNISLSTKILWPNTEQEMPFENCDTGSIVFAQVIASEGEDTESISILTDENNTIPTSDWWISTIISDNGNQYLYIQAHEDILPLTIDEIELHIQLPAIQKIPAQALSAKNGIKIGSNGEIELDYDSTTHIPYTALNGNNNTDIGLTGQYNNTDNPAEAIVLGSNNQYLTKGNKMLIIGNNNNINNTSGQSSNPPRLIIGDYLSDYQESNPLILLGQYNNLYLNNNLSDIPYVIIGNGTNGSTRSNILEITSTRVNINGNLYVNGTNIENINNSNSLDENGLSSYLSNNNYITTTDLSSYLSNNDYITSTNLSAYLSNNNYITSTNLNTYLVNNHYITTTDLSSYLSNNNYITSSYLSNNNYVTSTDLSSYVQNSITINNKSLNSNINLTAADVGALNSSAKVTSISSSSTNDDIPTAKAVWDLLETFIDEVLGGSY